MLKHLRTQWPVILGTLLVVLAFLGAEFRWYRYWDHLDTAFHFVGGVIAAWFVLALLQNDIIHLKPWKQVAMIVSGALLIGVFWEFAEYISGVGQNLWPSISSFFHGGDVADTLTDLVADIFGALLVAGWALKKERN